MSASKRKVTLLSCPFCGYQSKRSKPWLSTPAQREAGYGPMSYGVECAADLRCGAKVEGFPSQALANKAWNLRVGGRP